MKQAFLILMSLFVTSASANQYMYGPPTPYTALATNGAAAMAANSLRAYLLIQNLGPGIAYVKFGSAQTGGTDGIAIPSGGNYEPLAPSAQAIYLRTATGTTGLVLMQGQ